MSQSVNRVILVGNLGKDPELFARQSGEGNIANITLATSESWNDRQTGERREKTEWHRVVIYNDHVAGVVERRCQKGTMVYIEGSLQTRKWTDQAGQDRYTTEIVIDRFDGDLKVLGRARGSNDDRYADDRPSRTPPSRGEGGPSSGSPTGSDLDDEIPFGPCVD